MLDDLQLIHERDPQDALGVAEKQWQQLELSATLEIAHQEFDNVVLAGMGGSALAALVTQQWPTLPLPFEIVRNYNIPAYVSKKTLFIASSHSGNTEETLHALDEAEAKGATIAVICSGGKLAERAQQHLYPHIILPGGLQPRYAFLSSYQAIMLLTDAFALTKQAATELAGQANFVKYSIKECLPTLTTTKTLAKQIAQNAIGKSVTIYSGPQFSPAAYKWKISFNENAKQLAWLNQYTEVNHNEFIGCTKQPVIKPYGVVDIRSTLELPVVQRRVELSTKL